MSLTVRIIRVTACVALLVTPQRSVAQSARLPADGALVASLGQPPRWHWGAGISVGAWLEGPSSQLLARASGSSYRDLMSPIIGLAQVGAEGFIGLRDSELDGGVRGVFRIPFIGLGVGGEYNFRTENLDFLVTAQSPVVRGGVLVPGGTVRINWYPAATSSFTIGVGIPLGNPLVGRGRPTSSFVAVSRKFPTPRPYSPPDRAVGAVLDTLAVSAEWIRRATAPFLDQDGRSLAIADARNRAALAELQAHLAVRSAEEEVRFFYREMVRAFSLATRHDSTGARLAGYARATLLDQVLLPYNGLLGRKQWRDELADLLISARGRFGGLVAGDDLPPDRVEPALFVFQQLCDIVLATRNQAAREWDDPRLIWLPLQYALLPEQHDSQEELDALVERATHADFTNGNQVRYLANLQFHFELMQSVLAAKQYHALLIHDFPAVTPAGQLDWASFAQVLNYLSALTDRVREYDGNRTLPIYFIFLDQHYYEARKSRIWMDVLQDPLHASPQLPRATPDQVTTLTLALDALRTAVGSSAVLQAEARQYGDAWLRNRIKVQVNITNRADESFLSGGIISSFFAYPDNIMRDHRKVAFYDVTEADPYSGWAVYTGMGVGQQYIGPGWEDRSLLAKGPMLAELKTAVRELLLSQGMPERDIPIPFRAVLRPVGYDAILAAGERQPGFHARAMQLTNGTGFQPKPLNVAKAMLYSLMPRGSVIKIPDSLWNSFLYGGLLTGACLRGATVLIIAPAAANAPSAGLPAMIREWELMTRLLEARTMLAGPIAAAGGRLGLGLYAVPPDKDGMMSRVEAWNTGVAETPFLSELMPFLPTSWPVVFRTAQPTVQADTLRPKLHQKVQYLATPEMWQALRDAPEWGELMPAYYEYRAATYAAVSDGNDAVAPRERLQEIAERIFLRTRGVAGAAGYVLVGSQNQDYRGMFMDGEVDVLFSGAETLVPLVDLIFLEGAATWITSQEQLNSLLPPPTEYWRRWSRVLKDGV